jgi:DNA mismatch endonuclease (patch repair protein)
MADVHTKEIRSFNMSRIRSKDTKPEILVRNFLFANGFRYKLHDKSLEGKPDIVLPKYKTVIFIHGCFWHGHKGCRYFVLPKTRTEWWLAKINKNNINDLKAGELLSKQDWHVIYVWECELRKDSIAARLQQIIDELSSRLPVIK